MGQFAVGQPAPRDEDPRLLKGLGQYLDGIKLPEQAYGAAVIDPETGPAEVANGAGESGTVGAPPTVINAIVDALRDRGVTDVPMPATPLRVWQAIQGAAR